MNSQEKQIWDKISTRACRRALERINRISVSRWEIPSGSTEKIADYDSVCSYFQILEPGLSMSFAMFFRRSDLPVISKSLTGYGFFVSQKVSRSEELLVEELSNIILNSLISEISNLLKRKIIPSGPKTVHSPRDAAMEIISSALPENSSKIVFETPVRFDCGGQEVVCEVYSFLPEDMAERLSGI